MWSGVTTCKLRSPSFQQVIFELLNTTSSTLLMTGKLVEHVQRRAVVGEIDEEVDQGLDLNAIRATPLSPVQH